MLDKEFSYKLTIKFRGKEYYSEGVNHSIANLECEARYSAKEIEEMLYNEYKYEDKDGHSWQNNY